jgi:predicted glycosyltransferase
MMQQVLAAREFGAARGIPIVMLLGPFMMAEDRERIKQRASRLEDISIIDFDARAETLMQNATAIISMGGYNTFCEILSFDKPALLVPRTHPRREQVVRAERACELGLVDLIDAERADDPRLMARAINALLVRPKPSLGCGIVDLDGLERIGDVVERRVADHVRAEAVPLPV